MLYLAKISPNIYFEFFRFIFYKPYKYKVSASFLFKSNTYLYLPTRTMCRTNREFFTYSSTQKCLFSKAGLFACIWRILRWFPTEGFTRRIRQGSMLFYYFSVHPPKRNHFTWRFLPRMKTRRITSVY